MSWLVGISRAQWDGRVSNVYLLGGFVRVVLAGPPCVLVFFPRGVTLRASRRGFAVEAW